MDTAAELEPGAEGGRDDSPSPVHQISLWPPPRSTRHSGRRRRQVTVVGTVVLVLLLLTGGTVAAWSFLAGDDDDSTSSPSVDEFVGSWSGDMSQVNTEDAHVADWHAQVRIEEGAERGSTAWTTWSCSGTLELTARDGDRLVYGYTETSDPDNRCVDEAELTVWPNPDGDGLKAEWASVTAEGTEMFSTGVLD